MMVCVGLLVMWCQLSTPVPVDSFCTVYQQVVQEKGDGTIKGTLNARKRILANELVYKKHCKGDK